MKTRNPAHRLDLSRRGLLSRAALIAGGASLFGGGLSATAAAGASKMPQNAVNYQDKPRGNARCDNCTQWQPASSCKLVAGTISPSGWCSVYAPKS